MRVNYRAFHQLADLGVVDLDLGSSIILPGCSAISAEIPSASAESGRQQNCHDHKVNRTKFRELMEHPVQLMANSMASNPAVEKIGLCPLFFFSFFSLYLIMESELDLERVKGESPLLLFELFLAQMMSVMCCATRVMATESKGGFSAATKQGDQPL